MVVEQISLISSNIPPVHCVIGIAYQLVLVQKNANLLNSDTFYLYSLF